MGSSVLLVAMLTVTVDYGYEEMPDDGIRYVIQIEPELLDLLRSGQTLGSAIPPEVRGRIHAFKIESNRANLSKEIPPLPQSPVDTGPLLPEIPNLPETQDVPTEITPPPEIEWPPELDGAEYMDPPKRLPGPEGVVQASVIEKPAAPVDGPSGEVPPEDTGEVAPTVDDPSFFTVLLSVFALGSSSGMLFFGWLAFDYRSRYLGLLRDSIETGDSWMNDPLDVRGPTDREPVESSRDSENAEGSRAPEDENIVFEDTTWRDLGADADAEDGLDDWLNEDKDQRRGSRRGKR